MKFFLYSLLIFQGLIIAPHLFSDGKVSSFRKYNNNHYFVETGSGSGAGISFAIMAGFQEVRSVEAVNSSYALCCKKFDDVPIVKLWNGDSSKLLWEMIQDINEPITFWLDGHYHKSIAGVNTSPLIHELKIIAKHPVKSHTIMIDDIRRVNVNPVAMNMTVPDIITHLREINPKYQFTFEDGFVKNDILVAFIP